MPDKTWAGQQLARALRFPNQSPDQIRKLENWAHDTDKAVEARVWAIVAETSKATKETEDRLKAEVKDALLGLQATVKEAQAHRVEYPELSAEIDARRKVLTSAEARLQSLESSVQRSEEILDDPHAYMDSIYRRYPALDKRTRLVEGVLDI